MPIIGETRMPFTGSFEGNNHEIVHFIHTSNRDVVGFFALIGKEGMVTDLTLRDVDITARNYVGGLAGQSEGTVSNCQVTGRVSGEFGVGGLIGWNWSEEFNRNIKLWDVDVYGNSYVGQIVGIPSLDGSW